jgi:tRNA-modifying protein YgfZ
MTNHQSPAATVCALEDLGALRFTGPDAGKFLQGQLSNDLQQLVPGSILRAGLHNPQGRTVAVLWLAARDGTDEILAFTPRELVATVASQLRRYVLRAKVTIHDDSTQCSLYGLLTPGPTGGQSSWSLDSNRRLLLLPHADGTVPETGMSRAQWRALDIAAGWPQLYAATSALFVAQMLNLDCIQAISFTKGCYTGQEVIARAHYRGRVKRRMQRFESLEPRLLHPGDAGRFEDGRSFRVIEALQRADRCSEFLAVAALPAATSEPEVEREQGAAHEAGAQVVLRARALPLPYELPD